MVEAVTVCLSLRQASVNMSCFTISKLILSFVVIALNPRKKWTIPGLDIKHLVYMPVGHVVLKNYVPCKNFHMSSQYLHKPCKVYVYCWKNKYIPRLKNQLPSRACNHKSLCALGQDLHALGMRANLNVEPCIHKIVLFFAE